jgi:hypothetical protein
MCGVLVGLSLRVPSLASVSTISFPVMPECAYTLCNWIVYLGDFTARILENNVRENIG